MRLSNFEPFFCYSDVQETYLNNCDRIWEKGPFRAMPNCSVHGQLGMVVVHMSNWDYFSIHIYCPFPTFCESLRPTAHLISSAQAFKDDYRVLPLRVYGFAPEINAVRFTARYVRCELWALFAALAARYESYSLHYLVAVRSTVAVEVYHSALTKHKCSRHGWYTEYIVFNRK